MNSPVRLVVFAAALAVLAGAIPGGAEAINTGTVLATVSEAYADCSACSYIIPHGCYLVITPVSGDPIAIHIAADITESSGANCSAVLAVDDCIQVTGQIVNAFISAPLPGDYLSSFQLETTTWMKVNSLRCSS